MGELTSRHSFPLQLESLQAWLNSKGSRELALKNTITRWRDYILAGSDERHKVRFPRLSLPALLRTDEVLPVYVGSRQPTTTSLRSTSHEFRPTLTKQTRKRTSEQLHGLSQSMEEVLIEEPMYSLVCTRRVT